MRASVLVPPWDAQQEWGDDTTPYDLAGPSEQIFRDDRPGGVKPQAPWHSDTPDGRSEPLPRERVADTVRRALRAAPEAHDLDAVVERAVDYAIATLRRSSADPLVKRIGAVYTDEDLHRWLTSPGTAGMAAGEFVSFAEQVSLVRFRTADGQLVYPSWQFDAVDGRLVVREDVTALWGVLPHNGWMVDVDLISWMRTPLGDLDSECPSEWVRIHGMVDPRLQHAIGRLRRRVT